MTLVTYGCDGKARVWLSPEQWIEVDAAQAQRLSRVLSAVATTLEIVDAARKAAVPTGRRYE